jgi:hypothetical protein
MIVDTVSANEMRAAQALTGAAMAIWIGVGIAPGLRKYARTVRGAVLALYLLACLSFILYAALGKA